MKILLAPDKFKGSLSASAVCSAMAEGIRRADPSAEILSVPMADGGEGTANLLTEGSNGTWLTCTVQDPLGRPVKAGYGLSGDKTTAFIEMAQASGLRLLKPPEYDPYQTSTFGTGELIAQAIGQGVSRIVLGIGGSATNDAGTGMAAALGWRFLAEDGHELRPCGGTLGQIARIIPPDSLWNGAVDVACDVANPLIGPQGASFIYGPQKGAQPADLPILDAGMAHLANVIRTQFGLDVSMMPGAGAAGGLGAGAVLFLKGQLTEGVDLLIKHTRLAEKMAGAALVFTGEGRIDTQTLQGKLIAGITRLANEQQIPVVALCGSLQLTPEELERLGVASAFSIIPGPVSLDDALTNAAAYLQRTTYQVMRLITSSPYLAGNG